MVAEGEVLRLTPTRWRDTVTDRLEDQEPRLGPARFVRITRGTITDVDRIAPEWCDVSRIQSRALTAPGLRLQFPTARTLVARAPVVSAPLGLGPPARFRPLSAANG